MKNPSTPKPLSPFPKEFVQKQKYKLKKYINPTLASEFPPYQGGLKGDLHFLRFLKFKKFTFCTDSKGGLRGISIAFNSFIFFFLLNFSVILGSDIAVSTVQNINYSFTFGVGISADMDSIARHTDRSGLAFNFRFMIESFTDLSIGIEASYINISKFKQKNVPTVFGITDIGNQLTTIPILLVVQHKLFFLQIYGGYGPSYVISEINSFGETSQSSEWDYSLMAGLSYSYNIYQSIKINAEVKYFVIPPLFKNILNGQISVSYGL